MYCPGHAGVKRNDQADRLAGKASITSGLYIYLRRFEVLWSFRDYLQAQSQGHHTIDHLEERGVERGSTQQSPLKGQVGYCQSDEHWSHFIDNVGETFERQGGAHSLWAFLCT